MQRIDCVLPMLIVEGRTWTFPEVEAIGRDHETISQLALKVVVEEVSSPLALNVMCVSE